MRPIEVRSSMTEDELMSQELMGTHVDHPIPGTVVSGWTFKDGTLLKIRPDVAVEKASAWRTTSMLVAETEQELAEVDRLIEHLNQRGAELEERLEVQAPKRRKPKYRLPNDGGVAVHKALESRGSETAVARNQMGRWQ